MDKMNNHKNNSEINVPTDENELLRSSELYYNNNYNVKISKKKTEVISCWGRYAF